MVESASPENTSDLPAARSPLPWILLVFFLFWLCALAWMARGEFKARPKHERERSAVPLERSPQ